MSEPISKSRRKMLKGATLLFGAAVLPVSRIGFAQSKVSEDDGTAEALNYKHEAGEAEKRSDSSQFCHNCRYFRGGQGDEWAACELFGGQEVKGEGWCTAWAAK